MDIIHEMQFLYVPMFLPVKTVFKVDIMKWQFLDTACDQRVNL